MTAMRFLPVLALLSALVPAARAAGPSFEDWLKHRDAVQSDPDVVRFYVLEPTPNAPTHIPSLAGDQAPLNYGVVGEPTEQERSPQYIAGRFPQKKAVRLDRGIFSAAQFPVKSKTFSVEAWVRTHGQGAIKGDAGPQSGTLLSEGVGYWDGWRLTISYPDCTLGFELGKRPGAEFLRTGPVADGVWHQIVLTWDGRTKCIFVDGALAAAAPYAEDYVPPDPGAVLRLGFAGSGWGAAIADFDEVVVYRRALTAAEVLQHALYYVPLDRAAAEAVTAPDATPESYQALCARPGLHPHVVAAARLRLAQAYLAQLKLGSAVQELVQVLGVSDLPEGMRSAAALPVVTLTQQGADLPLGVLEELLGRAEQLSARQRASLRLALARAYARAGRAGEARAQYEAVMAMPELTARETLDLSLQTGHACCLAGKLAEARAEYEGISSRPDAPASYRAQALLCAARTYVWEKQYAEAEGAYRRVGQMADAPAILAWEAGDCLREVARLRQGLPARDPAWDRVKLPDLPTPGAQLWVSPQGDDQGPGSREKPFATLAHAQAAVRALRAQGLPAGGVAVNLLPGSYPLRDSLKFTAADSGTPQAPVVWRAVEPGTVTLTGGQAVTGLKLVTDAAILARLPEEGRGKVCQVDLKAAGITDFGVMRPRGFARAGGLPALEVFCAGQPLTPARWPKDGFAHVAQVLSNDDNGAVFTCAEDRIRRWTTAKDAWFFGYPSWQWADERDPIKSIDAAAHKLTLSEKVTYGTFNAGAAYFIYNLLEELGRPGEWYLDRQSGVLYVYPLGDPAAAELTISLLATPFIETDGASWVLWQGLTLEYGRWHGAVISGGDHCLLAGCTIRNCGGDAVEVNGGTRHGIFGCELCNLGRGGSVVTGGDRKTLTPGGHFMENCHVHHFSRLDRTYTPAVLMNGCGNRIAHNRFHHSPCHSMRIEGNDHLIEFNEIYEMVRESDDQGGLDMFANPGYRGVILRYNYWHDMGTPYPTPCGQAGVRLDDAISGVWIYGNVFQRCSNTAFGAIQLHGGKDDVIVNNLFADCRFAISFSGWGADRWKQYLDSEGVRQLLHVEVEISKPPYSTRYPDLARLYESEGVHRVWRNVAFNCGEFLTRDRGIQDLMDNQVTVADPGFVGAERGDFDLKPDSPLLKTPAFRPLPVEEIGTYPHPLKAG